MQQQTFASFATFNINTKVLDLDVKFNESVSNLDLDTEGENLARPLTLRGAFGLFDDNLQPFLEEWYAHCPNRGDCE